MTFFPDTVMPYIARTQYTDGQKDASPSFLKGVLGIA